MLVVRRGTALVFGVVLCAGMLCPARADLPVDQTLRPTPIDRKLLLRTGVVELLNIPSLLSPTAVFSPDEQYVIHLDGPMTRGRRDALNRAGVVLREYLPIHAYVADLAGANAAELVELGFVDWVGVFDAAWKFSPELAGGGGIEREGRVRAGPGQRLVSVEFFDGINRTRAKAALESCGSVLRGSEKHGRKRHMIAELPASRLAELKQRREVMFVDEVLEAEPRNASTSWIIQSNASGIRPLWDAGLHGEDQIVGVIDWDMYAPHCAFSDPDGHPIGPLHRKIRSYYGMGINPNSGTHGTHVAGNVVADELADTQVDLKGMAYKAKIVFQHLSGVLVGGLLLVNDRLTIAHADGARIHSNSWGTSSTSYGAWSRDIDLFTRDHEEDLVLVAVANSGVTAAPENAKNCLAVAASSDSPNQNNFCRGSLGPTTDGRQKPEVFAPGCGSRSALYNTACGVSDTGGGGGTSYAAPAVAGMATLARQYFMEGFFPTGIGDPAHAYTPTGALLKAMIINSAVDMTGMPGYFTGSEGWGRVTMDDVVYLAGDARRLLLEDVRNADGLSTGENSSFYVVVGPASMPLKVSLIWTDEPAALMAAFTPVNNLDLEVTSPSALVYRGNVFSGAESTTGGAADAVNNAEQVHLAAPEAGLWRVDVLGTAVNVSTQGFAVVMTGDVDCLKGDVNGDGLVNGEDIGPFTDVLLNGGPFMRRCTADMNASGDADEFDVDEFVAALLGS